MKRITAFKPSERLAFVEEEGLAFFSSAEQKAIKPVAQGRFSEATQALKDASVKVAPPTAENRDLPC